MLRFLYEINDNSLVRKLLQLTRTLLVFLLVCCTYTSQNYARVNQLSDTQIYSESIKIEEIIRGKNFYNQISDSNPNTEFRVFIKTGSKSAYNLLSKVGKQARTFQSYSGMAISISKAKLYEIIFEGGIVGVWENSKFYTTADTNNLLALNSTQEIANFTSMVSAHDLWNEGTYGTNTKVAILDTGIKTDHLALNVTMNTASRILHKWNFLESNDNVEDDNGHGTCLAGIIGANGLYGYDKGVAPNCSFLIGKILDYNGVGTTELLIQGVDWAIENGADIINLSLGSFVKDKESPEIEAIDNAVENGTLVCAAAGNMRGKEEFGYNDLYTILSPGISKKAITVGAVDNNKVLYEHSSAGPVVVNYVGSTGQTLFDSVDLSNTWLKPDVVAPGVKINTTAFENQKTTIVTGTSYSTAVVTGVCSLLKELYPTNHTSTIKASLLSSSADISPEIVTPLGDSVIIPTSAKYQGSGLVNTTKASQYLDNPPAITIWPKQVPYSQEVYLLNELSSFYFSIYVNLPITSLSIRYYAALNPYMNFHNFPIYPSTGQYDILMELSTTEGSIGFRNFPLEIVAGSSSYDLDVSLYISKGKGRILFDCNELDANNFYSMYGNLYNLLDISKKFGFNPAILSKDGVPTSISDYNMSDFEVVSLINFNSSNRINYSLQDKETILNFALGNQNNGGKTLILLPSRSSDILGLNAMLQPFNISYKTLLIANETLDVSSLSNEFFSCYNSIDFLVIPSPLEVVKENDSSSTILDRFVFYDSRSTNNSLIIAGNNVEMFQYSPYLYSSYTSSYHEDFSSLHFADNYRLFENIIAYSAIYEPTITYSLSTPELSLSDQLIVTMNASNNFGILKGWDFFLTVRNPPGSVNSMNIISYDLIDYGNGTYKLFFSPEKYSLSVGDYLLSIRSSFETKTWSIYLLSDYSYGPLIVVISITICVLFFSYARLRRTRKFRR